MTDHKELIARVRKYQAMKSKSPKCPWKPPVRLVQDYPAKWNPIKIVDTNDKAITFHGHDAEEAEAVCYALNVIYPTAKKRQPLNKGRNAQ